MELVENRYQIQGLDVLTICQEFGTPLYLYDGNKIEQKIHYLKQCFAHTDMQIKYACKALTSLAILQLMKKNGVGLDTVSIQEVQLGLMAGFEPHEILFTPNCVDFAEIQEAVQLGVTINIDNISILEQFGATYGNTVPCCIRLNPHLTAGGNTKIQVGHIDSKFGISILQLRHVHRIVQANHILVKGLHVHTGSDILESEIFLRSAEIIFEAAYEFKDLTFIDFGSGFKVPYKETDIQTDIADLGLKLGEAFESFCQQYGRKLAIWFEPGKYLVSEAGYLLVKANTIKQTPSTVFVGVNSGMNHLIRPALYNAYHQIQNISNPTGVKRLYSVVGYICETDTLGWDRKLNEVREGDILAIKNAGAYGYVMSSNYNSRLRPAEVLIYQNKVYLIRKRETLEDLIRNQIPLFS
ncbi:MAG: diaminopimelate decarboxylase [Microscillaceae bacterium]|nr:diaminopimelate decarboxylase [Microscillaceae bacterium]MDW8461650.1 diaminopimelate decarboxylase [Cytophagales bacterium]